MPCSAYLQILDMAWKTLQETNALAYFVAKLATKKKVFNDFDTKLVSLNDDGSNHTGAWVPQLPGLGLVPMLKNKFFFFIDEEAK